MMTVLLTRHVSLKNVLIPANKHHVDKEQIA